MSMSFDLFPTLLQLAGIPLPSDRIIDGRDMLPLLAEGAPTPHEALYYYDARWLRAVRQGPWKYHKRHVTDNAGYWPLRQGPFLFNVERDPNESYSLVDSEPDVATELDRRLQAWQADLDENLRGWLPSS
jgi:arylsulfatase A-like enzyme